MVKLVEKIEAEKENVDKALANLKDVLKRDKKTVIELSAMAAFLHNFYSVVENILKHWRQLKENHSQLFENFKDMFLK